MDKYSVWQVNDKNGKRLGILKTELWLDIIDVRLRAKNKFGINCDCENLIYLGELDF